MRIAAVLVTLLLGSLAACGTDYVQMSRELARQDLPDLREPIVEKQRTFYDRDTSRPRLETTYRVYPGGRKVQHGAELCWFENGQLRWEREYSEGEPVGHWTSYYRDGTPESETWPGADPTPRTAIWWYPDGQRSSEGPTVRGAREGVWTTWHQNGAKESEGRYAANRREGEWTFWGPDGELTERGSYRAGSRIGSWERAAETEP